MAACTTDLGDDLARGGSPVVAEPETPAAPIDSDEGPALVRTSPENGASDVELDASLTFIFDRPVALGQGTLTLVESLTGAVVEEVAFDEPHVVITADEAEVQLPGALSPSTGYHVLVTAGALLAENGTPFVGLDDPTLFTFSTRPAGPPVLVSTLPVSGATEVALDTELVFTFDQPVIAGDEGELLLFEAVVDVVVQSVSLTDTQYVAYDDAVVTVSLPAPLAYETEYYVTLANAAVQSGQGVAFDGFSDASRFTFRTQGYPDLRIASTVPADDAVDVDPGTSLVLRFDAPVVAGSGDIRVYAADGTLFEAVPIDSERVHVSNRSVTCDLRTLGNDTEYYVQVDAGVVLGADGGRFPGIADTTTFSFRTAVVPPPALVLLETSPTNGATGVPVVFELMLTFGDDVELGTGSITVFDAMDDSVAISVEVADTTVAIDGSDATVVFDTPLQGNHEYYVVVEAGSFHSSAGASFSGLLDSDLLRFVTETTFDLVATTPAHGELLAALTTDLVLEFSAAVEPGSGTIEVRNVATQQLFESVDVSDPRVTVEGSSVTVDLDSLLAGDTEYEVLVAATAIVQVGGSAFVGLANQGVWTFATRPLAAPGGVDGGLALWLDAALSSSLKGESGIALWADRSGRQNDVRQGTMGAQPALVADSLAGHAGVRFDGAGDHLSAATNFPFTAFEGFLVWRSDIAPGSSKTSMLINDKNFEVNHGHAAPARNALAVCVGPACEDDRGWHSVRFSPVPLANTPYLWDFGFDATTTSTFVRAQGSAAVFNTAPSVSPTTPLNPFSVGGDPLACGEGCFFGGDVFEVILYSRSLTQSERLAVTGYLRDKWELPLPACGQGESLGPNGSCYFLEPTAMTFDGARTTCQARGPGWDLASVRSEEDHTFATSLLTGETWIGASDSAVEGTWRWVNDTLPFWSGDATGNAVGGSFTRWLPVEEPNFDDCARYSLVTDWVWRDSSCTLTFASLCEGPGD